MKFKTFLLQEEANNTEFEDTIKSIAKKCKPFLTESKDIPMFRGIADRKITSDGFRMTPQMIRFTAQPKGRGPRDSVLTFNIMFDSMIDCAFGIKDIRTHTVFASGNPAIAGGYGSENVIFPVGEFKYVWSPKINDSVSCGDWVKNIARFGSQHGFHLSPSAIRSMWDNIPNSEEQYFASRWVKGGKTIINNTQSAYTYNDRSVEDTEESIYQMIKDGMMMYGNKFYENNVNLTKALRSGHEILIYESQGYYSIPIKIALDEYNKAKGTKESAEWEDMYKFILEEIAKVK